MGKKKALAAGAAVAAGPSGLRRVVGGCLVVALLLALGLAGLMSFGAWLASRDGGLGGDDGLPCPPETVAVAYTPADIPLEVQAAVEEALSDAGRESVEGGYGSDQDRDIVVHWWPTDRDPNPPEASGSSTVSLRLQEVPTAEEVTEALGDHLSICDDPKPTEQPDEAPEEAPESEEDEDSAGPIFWPWQQGLSPVVGAGFVLALWWLAGPQAVRLVWKSLWPVRLTIRRWQRRQWRREVADGDHELPTWPEPPVPGELWDTTPEAMYDRRTFRQQIRQTEPERKATLRERIREGRLRGEGIVPVQVWRLIYRVPTPETSDDHEAST